MFPINFNFPYRKKDGSIITMEKALDGAGADLDLIDLDDVAITTPIDNDGLVYDATAQKWENKPVVTGDLWAQNGAHNLLPFPYNSGGTQVISSFTLTVNDSGVDKGKMSASGTANESNRFNLYVGKLPKNNYKFRFVGSLSGVEVAIYDYVIEQVIDKAGANEDITLTVDATNENHNFLLYLRWDAGSVSISGRPLLKLASDPSNTDTPYAMTNRELTEKKVSTDKYRYKDCDFNDWTFTANSLAGFFHELVGYAVGLGFDYVGESFTGVAAWSGHNNYNFIVREVASGLYDMLAWNDGYVFTARYQPGSSFDAYQYNGTHLTES